jgi:hypothetical protein
LSTNQTISQLPTAQALTGTELVPIVQDGGTVKTTVANIAATPATNYSFVTATSEGSLGQSRQLSTSGNGLTLTDNGAGSTLNLSLSGAAASLVATGTGIQVKTNATTLAARSIAAGTAGLSVADGDGVAGDPTVSLSGMPLYLAQSSGVGLLTRTSGNSVGIVTLQGTADQINVANGTGDGANPTVGLADNPILPGTAATIVPKGTTAQRPAGQDGMLRYNTDASAFEVYDSGWINLPTGGVSQVNTGTGLTGGPITSSGTIAIANTAVTPATYGTAAAVPQIVVNQQGQITSATEVAISPSAIGAVASVTGTANEIDVAGTTNVVVSLPAALDLTGKTITGGDFNMVVAAVNSIPVVTTDGTQTLTNKTISGTNNTLSDINNGSLVNSSLNIGSTSIALGATASTLGGLTSVAVTQDPVSALELATKQYVDAVAEGLHVHASCAAATPDTLAALTGGSVTYNNGSSGVGATLTLGVALTTLDGYTLLNTNRILVKNEANQAHNGIYTWATGGTVLTRAVDFDTPTEIASGDFTFISNGSLYANTGWVQTQPCNTVGTDPIVWSQFSGAGTYTAGTGLTLVGTQFSLTTPVAINLGGTNGTATPTAGAIAYGTGTAYAFSSAGSASQVLLSGGSGVPTWTNQSSITAGIATNVAGGAAGALVYQTAAATTSTLALGTQGYVLRAGASAPEWAGIDGGTF